MSEDFLGHLKGLLAEIEADGLTKREAAADRRPPGRADRRPPRAARGAKSSISAPTTIWTCRSSRDHRGRQGRARRLGLPDGTVRFICGTQTLAS